MNLLLAAVLLVQDHTIENLIVKLGSDRVAEREEAARELIVFGENSIPALQVASGNKDFEVARRASQVLEAIHDQLAGKVFRKIEDALLNAKSIRIGVAFDWFWRNRDEQKRYRGKANILIKEGNKVSVVLNGTDEAGKQRENRALSNGNRMDLSIEMWDFTMRGTLMGSVSDLNAMLPVVFARGGGEAVIDCWRVLSKTPDDFVQVSAFKEGEMDGMMKTLSYKLKSPRREAVDGRLWYEPERLKIVKRTLQLKSEKYEVAFTETYDEFTLNADIPDEKFNLSEEKQ